MSMHVLDTCNHDVYDTYACVISGYNYIHMWVWSVWYILCMYVWEYVCGYKWVSMMYVYILCTCMWKLGKYTCWVDVCDMYCMWMWKCVYMGIIYRYDTCCVDTCVCSCRNVHIYYDVCDIFKFLYERMWLCVWRVCVWMYVSVRMDMYMWCLCCI